MNFNVNIRQALFSANNHAYIIVPMYNKHAVQPPEAVVTCSNFNRSVHVNMTVHFMGDTVAPVMPTVANREIRMGALRGGQ